MREFGSRDLMRPRRLDAPINERLHHIWVGPSRPGPWPALTRRQIRDVSQRVESYRSFWSANLMSLKRHLEGGKESNR